MIKSFNMKKLLILVTVFIFTITWLLFKAKADGLHPDFKAWTVIAILLYAFAASKFYLSRKTI